MATKQVGRCSMTKREGPSSLIWKAYRSVYIACSSSPTESLSFSSSSNQIPIFLIFLLFLCRIIDGRSIGRQTFVDPGRLQSPVFQEHFQQNSQMTHNNFRLKLEYAK